MNAPAPNLSIRPGKPGDHAAIRALLSAVFTRPEEADLVERLRADGDLVLELVAVGPNPSLAGYVAFARLRIDSQEGRKPAVGLAPLAVAAEHRRQGIGSTLIRIGLQFLARRGETVVFVVGDPAYYRRFGFFTDAARGFASEYSGPQFMALPLVADAPRRGNLIYPAAFAGI